MNNANEAAESFFLLAHTTRLLINGYRRGCKFNYHIKMVMTEGSPARQTKDDLPKPTGGYEIHIIIDPPPAQEQPSTR